MSLTLAKRRVNVSYEERERFMFAFLQADKSLRNKTWPLFTDFWIELLFDKLCHRLFTSAYMLFQTHFIIHFIYVY